jgi:ribokinase
MRKKPTIAVVGSFNMDLVVTLNRMPRLGETVAGEQIHYVPGGKGANQAVGCSRLGAYVNMIGALGDDMFGGEIARNMAVEGIDLRGVAIGKTIPTGTATILHTKEDNCIVVVSGANDQCTPEWVGANENLIRDADALLVQLEVPLPSVYRAMEIARKAGVPVVLNPAPATSLPEEMLRLADYLTPNETEFEYLCGKDTGAEELLLKSMIHWQFKYGHTLIVTRGKQGVAISDSSGIRTCEAPTVEVVDTTGAGDAFNAALCFGIASGWPIEQSAGFAVKAASLSVTKFGAQKGMPYKEEVIKE